MDGWLDINASNGRKTLPDPQAHGVRKRDVLHERLTQWIIREIHRVSVGQMVSLQRAIAEQTMGESGAKILAEFH